MLDVSHIPGSTNSTQIFYAAGGANDWQTWEKPRGAKFIQIFCLGAGMAGGAGALSNGTVSGGAGGNSGGLVKALFPAILLPDTLFIQVGLGGVGGLSTGGSGGISYVSMAPNGSIASPKPLLLASSTTIGSGGSIGGASGAGTPAAPTVTTTAVCPFLTLGIFTAVAGVQGGSGPLGAAGTSVNALGSNIVMGGAGGGGKTTNTVQYGGGSIISASVVLTTTVNGGVAGPNSGDNGYGVFSNLICGTGGAGGGGSITSGNAAGGNGWYGCGGGGGGASPASTPRGRGGNGGDGLVIITTIT